MAASRVSRIERIGSPFPFRVARVSGADNWPGLPVRASSRRIRPSPAFRGRGGARREAVGGEGLYSGLSKTLTSQAFGLGPSSPVRTGEGFSSHVVQARQALGLVLRDEGSDQLVELAFEDFGEAVQGQVDAVVGHPALGEIVGS